MNYKVEAWSWCADYCKKNQWNPHDSYFWNKALLEYRRQHNIFEVGDAMIIPSRGNGIFYFNALFLIAILQKQDTRPMQKSKQVKDWR